MGGEREGGREIGGRGGEGGGREGGMEGGSWGGREGREGGRGKGGREGGGRRERKSCRPVPLESAYPLEIQ